MSIYLTHYKTASTTYLELLDDIYYPQRVHWFPETYAKVKTGLVYVPHQLANMVLDKSILDYLNNNPVEGKTGFILAGGSQAWAGGKSKNDKSSRLTYTYKLPLITLTQIYAGRVASMCGVEDYVSTDASACASSLKVLVDVQNLINYYDFDRVCVLGVEDAVSDLTLEFFGASGANMTLKHEEEKGLKVSAFDSVNGGFYVGQGSAFAVFHSSRAIDKLGIEPKAELVGAYTASEKIDNAIGQRLDGEGYKKAIRGVLNISKLFSKDINIIKTHGTGTSSNNAAEKTAITEIFDDFVAVSYKQIIGHTVTASGLLESCLMLDDIKKGELPGIPNRTEHDNVFLSYNKPIPDNKMFLSLAAGMGNIYAAAIFNPKV